MKPNRGKGKISICRRGGVRGEESPEGGSKSDRGIYMGDTEGKLSKKAPLDWW